MAKKLGIQLDIKGTPEMGTLMHPIVCKANGGDCVGNLKKWNCISTTFREESKTNRNTPRHKRNQPIGFAIKLSN